MRPATYLAPLVLLLARALALPLSMGTYPTVWYG